MLLECEAAVRDGELNADELSRIVRTVESMERAVEAEFTGWHDSVRLLGQDNLRRYLPVSHLRVRLHGTDKSDDVIIAAAAALAVQCRAVFSYGEGAAIDTIDLLHRVTESWAGRIETICESEPELVEVIAGGGVDRLRILSDDCNLSSEVLAACLDRFVPIVRRQVVASGFIEPLWYLQEQSLSHDYHRYGNLGRRASAVS